MDLNKKILKDLNKYKDNVFAKYQSTYFQVCNGGYGVGDIFLGVKVKLQRYIAMEYCDYITLKDTELLLQCEIHEARFIALLILIRKYKIANFNLKLYIYEIYLRNFMYINNWDLVDLSAPCIPGQYWHDYSTKDLWEYAYSKILWKERVAIVSTLYFIKNERFIETLKLSKLFFSNKHHLIYKASGWMLREIGKINKKCLISFLDTYCKIMPRIMLRYSIEKLSVDEKKYFLRKNN
ncbi:MAG: DNA alkylation repair protein [Endomicrobium sp.]|jgi:3-methyladenine DNA glycosylase AlkD|nr:DNA alkylation repair protein [Endomicrobium sp.]